MIRLNTTPMDQLFNFFLHLFGAESWPARWSCGYWTSFHGWLYIVSSFLIGIAYFLIPFILFKLIRQRKDLPFLNIFWLFILFILACGTTHIIDGIIFWIPVYRLSAFVLLITAITSWLTVWGLIRLIPQLLTLRTPAQSEGIIRQRTEELHQSNLALMKMNQDLDNYVYAASHDLKSPINNIEGLVGIVIEDIEQGKIPEKAVIEKIQQSVNRVQGTISNLTEVISAEKNPYDDIEEVQIRELLLEIYSENEALFKKYNAQMHEQLAEFTLIYSRSALKSVLYNLITNALKYSSPDRPCEVWVRSLIRDGRFVLEVEDNGLGIDLGRYHNRLFKMFKRIHTHVEGSGIGLYSIKQLIERKGGTIEADSTPDKGTLFRVVF